MLLNFGHFCGHTGKKCYFNNLINHLMPSACTESSSRTLTLDFPPGLCRTLHQTFDVVLVLKSAVVIILWSADYENFLVKSVIQTIVWITDWALKFFFGEVLLVVNRGG